MLSNDFFRFIFIERSTHSRTAMLEMLDALYNYYPEGREENAAILTLSLDCINACEGESENEKDLLRRRAEARAAKFDQNFLQDEMRELADLRIAKEAEEAQDW